MPSAVTVYTYSHSVTYVGEGIADLLEAVIEKLGLPLRTISSERAALLVESGCLDQDSAENDGFVRGSFVDGAPVPRRIRPDPRLH